MQGSVRLCGICRIVGVIFIKHKRAVVFLCKVGEGDYEKAEGKKENWHNPLNMEMFFRQVILTKTIYGN